MAETPRDPIAQLLNALLDRERLANGLSIEQRARVQELFEELAEILRRIDPTGPGPARYRRLRTEKVLSEIQKTLRGFAPEMERSLRNALAPIGRQQAEKAAAGLVATLGTEAADLFTVEVGMTQQRLRAILNTDPFQGRLLKEHTETWSVRQYVRTRDQIRLGMVAEESIDDITKRVLGTQAGFQSTATGKMRKTGGPRARRLYRGGVLSQAERNAESLVRTAVTHVSNVGAMGTYEANADLLKGVEFVATLDDRTSVPCLSLDGSVWPVNSSDIQRPPIHFQCRSILVSQVDWDKLGLDSPPTGTRSARDLSTIPESDLSRNVSSRRSRGGFGQVEKIPSSTQAREWLRDQPIYVQNKMLGAGVAERWRNGELTLAQLIRQDNTVRTLEEFR